MTTQVSNVPAVASERALSVSRSVSSARSASRQAYELLHVCYSVAPVAFGLDKFLELTTDWEKYLAPAVAKRSPLGRHGTMLAVGAVEVSAGVLTAIKPKLGGMVVAGWLGGIIANLALRGRAWDVALRDFGLLLGAIALSRLSSARQRGEVR